MEDLICIVCLFFVAMIACFILYRFFPNQSAKNHGFIIVSIMLFLTTIYFFEGGDHFTNLDSWVSIADSILSGSIFATMCLVFMPFEKKLLNKAEDRMKLTQDYAGLARRYEQDNLVVFKYEEDEALKYPVICVGIGEIELKEVKDKINIEDSKEEKYKLPAVVEANYSEIFSAHKTSTVYNNINIRVSHMSIDDGVLTMCTQRTTYFDSLVTNRAADYSITRSLTIRELFEFGPRMSRLEDSKMSNHLGFNGFIESSDGYIVFIKRSPELSIGKNTYGDSINASLKTKYALDDKGEFDEKGLFSAVIGEIKDELLIEKEDVELETLRIIAAYRDCVECGKPQLLIYAKSKQSAQEISAKFIDKNKEKISDKKRLTRKEKQELRTIVDGKKIIWISKNSLVQNVSFEYSGIKTNASSDCEGFVYFKGKRKILFKANKIQMVPSASAAVVLFKEFIERSER